MADMLEKAIQAIRSGDKRTGRQLLVKILKSDRRNEEAWLWMTQVSKSHDERIRFLQNVLKINPDNETAQRGLSKLQRKASTAQIRKAAAPKEVAPRPEEDVVPEETNVPPKEEPSVPNENAFLPETVEAEEEVPTADQEEETAPVEEAVYAEDDLLIYQQEVDASEWEEDTPEWEEAAFEEEGMTGEEDAFAPEMEMEEEEEETDPEALFDSPEPGSDSFVEKFNALDNRTKLIATVPAAVMFLCIGCCIVSLVANTFFFGQDNPPEQVAVADEPSSEPTVTPTPTLAGGLTVPQSETPVLPTTPLEPTSTNTPVVPPTGTPSTTPAPTNTPTPEATTGDGEEPLPPEPSFQEAQVVEVIDGETIIVTIDGAENTVRYLMIDTPPAGNTGEPAEVFGPEAAEFNRALVEDKTVLLEKDVTETDPQGRLLRYVWVNELLVNEELLRAGLAEVIETPPDLRHLERFLTVQSEAQAAGIGLWSDAAREFEDTPTPESEESTPESEASG